MIVRVHDFASFCLPMLSVAMLKQKSRLEQHSNGDHKLWHGTQNVFLDKTCKIDNVTSGPVHWLPGNAVLTKDLAHRANSQQLNDSTFRSDQFAEATRPVTGCQRCFAVRFEKETISRTARFCSENQHGSAFTCTVSRIDWTLTKNESCRSEAS